MIKKKCQKIMNKALHLSMQIASMAAKRMTKIAVRKQISHPLIKVKTEVNLRPKASPPTMNNRNL
ncbi:hypothetical protein CISIN_1g0311051mg, partial [Citrus sinensis]